MKTSSNPRHVRPVCLIVLFLSLASARLASAQTNTGTGPNAKVATTNGTNAALSITTGTNNTAYGYDALRSDTTGSRNTAAGTQALKANTGGNNNTALGYSSLSLNTTGSNMVAAGYQALTANTTGHYNAAFGVLALRANTTGANNVAVGYQALYSNLSGGFNAAFGDGALYNAKGNGNIGIGEDGGFYLTTGSNNIYIGNPGGSAGGGAATESGKIRIGKTGTHTDTYLAGVIHGDGSGLTNVPVSVPVPLALGASNSGPILAGTNTGSGDGVMGRALGSGGAGVHGVGNASTRAGFFEGDVFVTADFSATGVKSFKIDHPLDPANKYLVHAAIESPDVKNLYDGIITTDGNGEATIVLPAYFAALNRDFRYQLTVLGQFAQAMVASEIAENQFTIRTDKPNVKVSWQVTGIRQDAYAASHPMVVEQDKPREERGTYLYPEPFNQPDGKGLSGTRLQEEPLQQPSAGSENALGRRPEVPL